MPPGLAQIFERFNVAPFSILDWPIAQLYAMGTLSGLVVDIGESQTDIALIYDSLQAYSCPNSCRSRCRLLFIIFNNCTLQCSA
jgi:hypothetical protein